MARVASFIVLIFVWVLPIAALATGTARIQHPDGTSDTYRDVRISIANEKMFLTSADGVGTIVIERAGCTMIDALLRCNPYSAVLEQHGEQLPVTIVESTAWLNPGKTTETLPRSSTRIPPRGVVLTMRSKNGTFLSLSGVVDGVKR